MGASHDSQNDLTSTIHLSQLRPVPHASQDAILDKLSPEERNIVSQLTPGKAMLIGVTGPGKGFRFLLDGSEISIGRDIGTDISLDDVTVSRRHATIVVSGNDYVLSDSKSLNGTYVNAEAVESRHLQQGDEIQIGKFRFIFFIGKVIS